MPKEASARSARRTALRHNPLGLPSIVDMARQTQAAAPAAGSVDATAIPFLQKLDSTDFIEREWACIGVATLSQDPLLLQRLVQTGVITRLVTMLADIEETVRLEAAGALRNIAVFGGSEVMRIMMANNILPPLYALARNTLVALRTPVVPTPVADANAASDASESARAESPANATDQLKEEKMALEQIHAKRIELTEQIVILIWTLGEESDEALNFINKSDCIPYLLDLLKPNEFPMSLIVTVAQTLNTLTEENQEIWAQFENPNVIQLLSGLIQPRTESAESMMLAVLISGILYNIKSVLVKLDSQNAWRSLLQWVAVSTQAVLSINLVDLIADVSTFITSRALTHEGDQELFVANQVPPEKKKYQYLEVCMRAQQLSLELLSNLYTEDDLGDTGSMEDDQDWDEMETDEMSEGLEEQGQASVAMQNSTSASSIKNDIAALAFSEGSYERIIAKSEPIAAPVLALLGMNDMGKSLVASYATVQARALGSLTNMFMLPGALQRQQAISPANILSHLVRIADVAAKSASQYLAQLTQLRQQSNSKDANHASNIAAAELSMERSADVTENATGAIYSLLRACDESSLPLLSSSAEIEIITGIYNAAAQLVVNSSSSIADMAGISLVPTQTENIRSNVVGSLGILGKWPQQSPEINGAIADLLLRSLHSDPSLWVACEIVSALFQLYGDSHHDSVFAQRGYLAILQSLVPFLSQRIKSIDKRKFKELWSRLDTARFNLNRFIKYKSKK